MNGYHRHDPIRGEEYVFDLDIKLEIADKSPKHEQRRIELVKPFSVPQIVHNRLLNSEQMLHFIVPVSASVVDRFQQFLLNFEDTCLVNGDMSQIFLLVVLFVTERPADKHRTDLAQVLLKNIQRRYRHLNSHVHIRTIQTSRKFSRALAVELGSKQLPGDALLFLCDVDVWFNKQFVNRCRDNAKHRQQVYYPIVFAQYNPDIVKQYSQNTVINLMEITSNTGE